MNAKTILLLILSFFSLTGKCHTTDPPDGMDIILLMGCLDINVGPTGVEAYVDEGNVYIYFDQSFGNVNISLYNEMDVMIFKDLINTSVQQTVIIPFVVNSAGSYLLIIEGPNGYVEGEFVITTD